MILMMSVCVLRRILIKELKTRQKSKFNSTEQNSREKIIKRYTYS